MQFKVVHIFSSLGRVNFGIWNAGIFGATFLKEKYGVGAMALVCTNAHEVPQEVNIPVHFLGSSSPDTQALKVLSETGFHSNNTIIVSHGCWLWPTRVAHYLSQNNYRWIYTPHGMLEPWSMSRGYFKKSLYWKFREKQMMGTATAIRAVGKIEKINLVEKLKRNIVLVENGVMIPEPTPRAGKEISFLFMARLHHKKGVYPLVKTWTSAVRPGDNMKLTIAGPDEGELQRIKPLLNPTVEYVGAVYGSRKEQLLRDHKYYILPSFSEGFPTSVLEAMSYGLIPLVSRGCNFPEIFEQDLGYEVSPDANSILDVLKRVTTIPFDKDQSQRNVDYVAKNYSQEKISADLYSMYTAALETS